MVNQKVKSSLLLFLTAFIWGVAFVAQSVGMDYVQPFTFNCSRSLIGGLFLIPCALLLDRISPERRKLREELKALSLQERKQRRNQLLAGGITCGVIMTVASNLQQFGIAQTTVGKAGFITAMYIVLVPIFGLFLKKKCSGTVWIGVLFAVAGLYFLCMTDGFSIQMGDALVFLCALAFAIHIMVIDHFTVLVDGVRMSCIQFLTCGILSGICMLLSEEPQIGNILAAWQPILYAGIMSCGVGYTLQIIGQRGMNPTVASLIMSLESVVSVLAGAVLLGQMMTGREILGCVLMFVAIVLAQLPGKKRKENEDL